MGYLAVFSTLELRKAFSWAPKASWSSSNVTCFSWLAVGESSFPLKTSIKRMPSSALSHQSKTPGKNHLHPFQILESIHYSCEPDGQGTGQLSIGEGTPILSRNPDSGLLPHPIGQTLPLFWPLAAHLVPAESYQETLI